MTFKKFYNKNRVSIVKSVLEQVVTSGYNDRFIRQKSHYVVTITINKIPVKCRFDFEHDMTSFLLQMYGGYDKSIDFLEMAKSTRDITEKKFFISGYINPCMHITKKTTQEERLSIMSYLHLYTGDPDHYTEKHIADCHEQLKNHPIDDDVLSVIKNQIAECDRKNEIRNNFNSEVSK